MWPNQIDLKYVRSAVAFAKWVSPPRPATSLDKVNWPPRLGVWMLSRLSRVSAAVTNEVIRVPFSSSRNVSSILTLEIRSWVSRYPRCQRQYSSNG